MSTGKHIAFIGALSLALVAAGCGRKDTADYRQAKATEAMMKEANTQVGMPSIVNFQELKLAKAIYELRDKSNLMCYAYLKSEYTGELHYIGRCLGYGLPYSVQFTNPVAYREVWQGTHQLMPQAEPNGLFMPEGLAATWVMMIDPKTNKPSPTYIESDVVISQFPLHVD